MRNKRKSLSVKIIFATILLGILFVPEQVLANSESSLKSLIEIQEYTDEYKDWLQLPEDKRKNTIEPRKYEVQYEKQYSNYLRGINNKIRVVELLKTVGTDKYDLREHIPMSVKIKNQESTNMCWAFAGTATLETHLALKDYKNNIKNVEYDFSERHMAYSTAQKSLLNSGNYLYGFNNEVSDGGNYFMVQQYLTTGNGAILDKYMTFVNTEESIDISEIQGKDVATTLLDTTLFATDGQTTRNELIAEMKSYITNYGGIYAGIHGASILSDYYNNETGAIYCDNSTEAPMNHAVLIIGWDDEFNKPTADENMNKFNSNCVPESYGAWIIKNSWGEYISKSLSEEKQKLYVKKTEQLNELGYFSAEEIPNNFVLPELAQKYGEDKITINEENDTITFELGDKGYMYVSYDDANIYSNLWGIKNAKTDIDYDNIYQYDDLGYSAVIGIPTGTENSAYIANVFSRDAQKEEELTKISIFTTQEYTCKVYVNSSDTSLNSNLQEAALAEGNEENTINIKPGYHTIEFAKPIKLTGEHFAVVMEISNSFERKQVAVEYANPNSDFENAVINEGESFVSFDMVEWIDTTTLNKPCNGNVTIKAFTNDGYTKVESEQVPIPEEKQAVLSNLDKLDVILTEINMSEDTEENYTITLNVNKININDEQTLHKYYWYISGTQGDNNIKDEYWAELTTDKIIKQSDGTYSLEIKINSINLPNKVELMNSDNLYLYIKEVATIDNNTKSQIISKAIEVSINVEKETAEKIEEVLKPVEDDTIANGIIPNAGIYTKILMPTLAMALIAVIAYNRFKYFDI